MMEMSITGLIGRSDLKALEGSMVPNRRYPGASPVDDKGTLVPQKILTYGPMCNSVRSSMLHLVVGRRDAMLLDLD